MYCISPTIKKGEKRAGNRVGPIFFDQVGHETMYASSGKKTFFSLNPVIVRSIKIMNRANKNWAHF